MSDDREQRRVKKLASKDLPYSLDSAKLLDMVPELDREKGMGRVLREVITATQGNFDHMRTELKRQTDYHNEHAEETNFIKEQTVPHEHLSSSPTTAPGKNDLTGDGWNDAMYFGGEYREDYGGTTVATCVPVFIDKPCTIIQMAFLVPVVGLGTAPMHLAIYAGDNESNYPGSLLFASDNVAIGAGTKLTETFELNVPTGWIWLGIHEATAAGTSSYLSCFDAGANTSTQWSTPAWPFRTDPGMLDTGAIGSFLAVAIGNKSVGDPWPDWAGEYANWELLYESYAPIINFLVR